MDSKIPPPVESTDSTAVHLAYMRRDVDEIKNVLKGLVDGYVTRLDFDEHLKADVDHETRIRALEKSADEVKTLIKTWGSAIALVLALIQVALHFVK